MQFHVHVTGDQWSNTAGLYDSMAEFVNWSFDNYWDVLFSKLYIIYM